MEGRGDLKGPLRFLAIVVISLAIVLVAFPLWQRFSKEHPGSEFAIANLRFVDYEGGLSKSRPYQAGDEVLLNFNLENIPQNAEGRTESVITFQPQDPNGRPLSVPSQKTIGTSERRAPVSFALTLPLYALGGSHSIRIDVDDRVSGLKLARTADFQVIGPNVATDANFGIQDHVFMETEGGPPMTEAAYRPGMKIRTGFHVVGFRLGPQNRIKLRVDLGVLGLTGEILLNQPNVVAIDQDLFYPALYLPVTTSVKTPEDIPAGTYRMRYTLHDDVSGQALSVEESFTVR